MTEIIINLHNVSKSYPASAQRLALDNVNLDIRRGEFFGLVGPSGCGKSTLLKLIVGLETPSRGIVTRPQGISMVFQSGALLPWLTVSENISFGLEMLSVPDRKTRELVPKYIEMVGLTAFRKKYPRELSGGQRQRVGIARALAVEPEALLLDEPFSALDPQTTEELHEDLLKIWKDLDITIVMVSHLLEEAVFLADRVGVMSEGRLKSVTGISLSRPRNIHDQKFAGEVKKIKELLK